MRFVGQEPDPRKPFCAYCGHSGDEACADTKDMERSFRRRCQAARNRLRKPGEPHDVR